MKPQVQYVVHLHLVANVDPRNPSVQQALSNFASGTVVPFNPGQNPVIPFMPFNPNGGMSPTGVVSSTGASFFPAGPMKQPTSQMFTPPTGANYAVSLFPVGGMNPTVGAGPVNPMLPPRNPTGPTPIVTLAPNQTVPVQGVVPPSNAAPTTRPVRFSPVDAAGNQL